MMLKELSDEEFKATFSMPMRFVEADASPPTVVNLRDYLSACLTDLRLPTTVKDIEIHYVYISGDEKYEHILFFYGVKNIYLVIVVDLKNATVFGHHILNLNAQYGLTGKTGLK